MYINYVSLNSPTVPWFHVSQQLVPCLVWLRETWMKCLSRLVSWLRQCAVSNGSLDHFGGICVEILRSLRGRNEVSAEKDLRVSLPRAMSRESALLRMFLFSSMKTFLVEGSARSVLERRSVSETVRRRRRRRRR